MLKKNFLIVKSLLFIGAGAGAEKMEPVKKQTGSATVLMTPQIIMTLQNSDK